ncbi:hypothetical protein GCM10009060_28400 [Halorubrum trapanicum]
MSEPVGVSTGVPDDEVIRGRVNRATAFGDDDEIRFWVASLNLASSSDVSVYFFDSVGITNHSDLRLIFEKVFDVPIKVWVSKIVIEHPDWQL